MDLQEECGEPADETGTLLARVRAGDAEARTELTARVYGELRRLAAGYMAGERRAHTLQATALVHEAFVRLARSPISVEDHAQFFAVAARAMRRVLIDHARARGRAKRERNPLDLEGAFEGDPSEELLDLEEALVELESSEPELARLVELRFFTGMEPAEIARLEGISERTVRRDLLFARGWLRRRMQGDDE